MRSAYRKWLAVLLCACIVSFVLGSCGKRRDSLVVGIDSEFPPYSYMDDDGTYVGFDVELARAFCEQEGWKLELAPINWDEKDTLLNDGKIDCIWSGFTINGREDEYETTVAYCDNKIVIAVPVDSGIMTVDDLAGKIVGVQAASSGADFLTKEEEGKAISAGFKLLSQFSDFTYSFEALADGSLDAIIADVKVADYFVQENGKFRILEQELVDEQYGVALKKGNTERCDRISKGLLKLAEAGTLKNLALKYGIEDAVCIGND